MSTKKEIGKWGEEIAKKYLLGQGYQLLEQNYQPRFLEGEIDLVVKKKKRLYFIEVKTLTSFSFLPEDKVDFKKRKKLERLIQSYLWEKKIEDWEWQLDLISIFLDLKSKKARVWHFKNI